MPFKAMMADSVCGLRLSFASHQISRRQPMTKQNKQADREAAKNSTKDGQKITRQKTRTRQEVRRDTTHKQGQPK
jgi:hypothetical protein